MKTRVSGLVLGFLCFSSVAISAGGIDKVYKKPSSCKTWGQQLTDYVGYGGYSKSYALVIGISSYDSFPNLPTENDPIRVKNFLIDTAGFDYVHLLTEEKATIRRIREIMVDTFPGLIDRNDRFLFYWSGHGATRVSAKEKKKGYLPLQSTPTKDKFSQMINMNNITEWDDLLKAKQTLYLLDSCFSGLAGMQPQSVDIRQLTIEQMAGPSRQLITAGTAKQQTIAIDSLGGSIFTTAVLDGLRGAADTTSQFDRDGLVSVHELIEYVKKRVAFERNKCGWNRAITPQPRDLAVNEGEFFFITSDQKVKHMVSRGLQVTDEFKYGEPVPMSGKGRKKPSEIGKTDDTHITQAMIRLTQQRLHALGYNPGPVDGLMGPSTKEALIRFQERQNLSITGTLDRSTRQALLLAMQQHDAVQPKTRSVPPLSRPGSYTNHLGMTFVYIPPGNFTMGSPKNERYYNDESPSVTLTQGFYLQTTEVTQGQWRSVMGSNPSYFSKCGDDCPVETVSWEDAQKFISRLNQMESGREYRLPTDAEWEYACRAGTQTRYYNGDKENDLDRAGWYSGNAEGTTHPAAQKEPNGWGLYDMHGNVAEWCADWATSMRGHKGGTNPTGPAEGSNRVFRGGSWIGTARICRAASGNGSGPGSRSYVLGFRLALSPGQPSQ